MKLDRSKKYEGLGLAWRSNDPAPGWWLGFDGEGPHLASASDEQMQAWLDAGHIKPVRETKIEILKSGVATSLQEWQGICRCGAVVKWKHPEGTYCKSWDYSTIPCPTDGCDNTIFGYRITPCTRRAWWRWWVK